MVGKILGVSSSVAVLDGGDEVGIGLDFAEQLVAHDVDEIIAGQQVGGVAVDHALLGEEHQRHHHQCHVMVAPLGVGFQIVTAQKTSNGFGARAEPSINAC